MTVSAQVFLNYLALKLHLKIIPYPLSPKCYKQFFQKNPAPENIKIVDAFIAMLSFVF